MSLLKTVAVFNIVAARRFITFRLRLAKLLVRTHAILFLFGTRHRDGFWPQAESGRMPGRTEREKKNARLASMGGRQNRKLSKDAPKRPPLSGGRLRRVRSAFKQARVRPQEGAEFGRISVRTTDRYGIAMAIQVGMPEVMSRANGVARALKQDVRRTVRTACRLRGYWRSARLSLGRCGPKVPDGSEDTATACVPSAPAIECPGRSPVIGSTTNNSCARRSNRHPFPKSEPGASCLPGEGHTVPHR